MKVRDCYGGFWLRVCAVLIDSVIFIAISFVISTLLGIKMFDISPNPAPHPNDIYYNLFSIGFGLIYQVVLPVKYKATIGKYAMGLVVLDAKSLMPMTMGQGSGRYLVSCFSYLCACLGCFAVGISKRKQGWHDLAAGTVVVKKQYVKALKEAKLKSNATAKVEAVQKAA